MHIVYKSNIRKMFRNLLYRIRTNLFQGKQIYLHLFLSEQCLADLFWEFESYPSCLFTLTEMKIKAISSKKKRKVTNKTNLTFCIKKQKKNVCRKRELKSPRSLAKFLQQKPFFIVMYLCRSKKERLYAFPTCRPMKTNFSSHSMSYSI